MCYRSIVFATVINMYGEHLMSILLGRWGIDFRLGSLVIHIFLGDLYLKVPKVGELAWNSTGFFLDKGTNTDQR